MNISRFKHILSDHIFNKEVSFWLVNYTFRPLRRIGLVPDEFYLKNLYRCQMHETLDLKNPHTFSQKLQWLKLYYRKSEFTTMVDKYAVKQYVAGRIGEEYIIPTLGAWNSFDEIDFDILPDQFVLKSANGCGNNGVVICTDKLKLDKKAAKKRLEKSMKLDCYVSLVEWPYHYVPRRIIAEKFMTDKVNDGNHKDLIDYKFYCFSGNPEYCQVIRDRNTKETIDFYDMDWQDQHFYGLNLEAKNGVTPVECPKELAKMKEICAILSKDIPFSRIDLYVINEKIYFGEITLYPSSGFGGFRPECWNRKLGDMLTLPPKNIQ